MMYSLKSPERNLGTKRLCPCIEDAYWNGTIDLPPSVNEGAIQFKEEKGYVFSQF